MIHLNGFLEAVSSTKHRVYPMVADPFKHATLLFPVVWHVATLWDTVDLLTQLCHEEDNAQKDG